VEHLRKALDAQDLLLGPDAFRRAESDVGERGEALLVDFVARWRGVQIAGGSDESLRFESPGMREHIQAALAFGAVTATVLAPGPRRTGHGFAAVERLCAIFNLGIGVIDNLCDDDASFGLALLHPLNSDVLMRCSAEPRDRGWLRMAAPAALAANGAAAFAADLIEIFFEELHAAFPDEQSLQLRHNIGAQLAVALAAERDSVSWSLETTEHDRSCRSSRLTSVAPFQIIETIASGAAAADVRPTGVLLGEAMWRIDDLVDLIQDARSGALNSVLLRAFTEIATSGPDHDVEAAVRHVLAASIIAEIATEAADDLSVGLASADPHEARDDRNAFAQFLYFVQSYAGLEPD
jgi:hypothetical protein